MIRCSSSFAAIAIALLAATSGCAADVEQSQFGAGVGAGGARSFGLATTPLPTDEVKETGSECDYGSVHHCKVYRYLSNDAVHCMNGMQVCEDDGWGPCTDYDDLQ